MSVTELNRDQLYDLNQQYLINYLSEVEDRSPSWGELADADEIVPDNIIFEAYDGTCFEEDDFCLPF